MLALCFVPTIAVAEWKIGSFVDRTTDKRYNYAELPAREGKAVLYVGCVDGKISPDIQFRAVWARHSRRRVPLR